MRRSRGAAALREAAPGARAVAALAALEIASCATAPSPPAPLGPEASVELDCARAQTAAQTSRAAYRGTLAASHLPSGLQLVRRYHDEDRGGVGLFALEAGAGRCHVAFKGTTFDSTKDLSADVASMRTTACETSTGRSLGACGEGFYETFAGLRREGLVRDVHAAMRAGKCPGGLLVTGHSLGGALASLLSAELVTDRPDLYDPRRMTVETFGEPRVFSAADAERLQAAVTKTRWLNWGDPVPTIPPTKVGFSHFGTPRLINLDRAAPQAQRWTFRVRRVDYSAVMANPLNHKVTAYIERLENCPGGSAP